jgi:hypothetical protein
MKICSWDMMMGVTLLDNKRRFNILIERTDTKYNINIFQKENETHEGL